ncbi:MAG: hypothetical protein PF961_16535 [Planctomycetota bacterium]|jgi:hypothetical protein|nr:hypothetical protein [Planctomycetota bacterium]
MRAISYLIVPLLTLFTSCGAEKTPSGPETTQTDSAATASNQTDSEGLSSQEMLQLQGAVSQDDNEEGEGLASLPPIDPDSLVTDMRKYAYGLALFDNGKNRALVTIPMVNTYEHVLSKLCSIYKLDARSIANMTFYTQGELTKSDITETNMNIMRGMRVLNGGLNTRYAEFVAIYSEIRKQGIGHDECIANQVAFMDAIEANAGRNGR